MIWLFQPLGILKLKMFYVELVKNLGKEWLCPDLQCLATQELHFRHGMWEWVFASLNPVESSAGRYQNRPGSAAWSWMAFSVTKQCRALRKIMKVTCSLDYSRTLTRCLQVRSGALSGADTVLKDKGHIQQKCLAFKNAI